MENEPIILSKLKKAVGQFADSLREKVFSNDYLTYFFPLFFFKYICDRSGKTEGYIIPKDAAFYSVVEKCNENNIGEELNKALSGVEYANGDKLSGIFNVIRRETTLHITQEKRLLWHETLRFLAHIDLSPISVNNDIIVQLFSWILNTWAKERGKMGAGFFTPRGITKLMARIIQARSNESIYDPACGSGRLLIEMAKAGQKKPDGINLYGQEINEQISCLARMNLIINELGRAEIEAADSINHPPLITDQDGNATVARFDIAVSNPPFSVDKWWKGGNDYGRFKWGMPPLSKGDYAFILHMLAATNESGRVAVIVSHGVLFRGGSELTIREHIIKNNLLDAVIGLPANIFTDIGIPAALLIFDKRRKSNNNILFIDASREFVQDKRINILGEGNIDSIVSAFNAFKNGTLKAGSNKTEVAHRIVPVSEVEANGFNINIARYVEIPEKKEIVDIKQLQKEVDDLELKLAVINKKIQRSLDSLGDSHA